MDMIKKLHIECEEFMSESVNAKSAHDIVNDIVDYLGDYIFDNCDWLYDYYARAVALSNFWVEGTLEDYTMMSNELIEELCGELAEYFA